MLLPIIVPILSAALGLVPFTEMPLDPGLVGSGNPVPLRPDPDRPRVQNDGLLSGVDDSGNPVGPGPDADEPCVQIDELLSGAAVPGNPVDSGLDADQADSPKPGGEVYPPGTQNPDDHQRSGICGTVYSSGGNHMPAPNRRRVDSGAPKHLARGVRATVCIFRLTSDSQVVHVDPTHYRAVLTPLISQIETDEKGQFQVFLPPGTYSVLTKKGELFYASRRDEKNHIAPVEVLPGKMTQVTCSVESDHKAVY